MISSLAAYLLILIIASIVSIGVMIFALRRKSAPGAVALGVLMGAAAIWTQAYAFEVAAPELTEKIFWARVQFIGIVVVPAAYLVFTLQYTGRQKWVTPTRLMLLSIVPAFVLLSAWIGRLQAWMWIDPHLVEVGPVAFLQSTHGPVFWLNVVYAYVLLISGLLQILQAFFNASPVYRSQLGLVLIGALIPWMGNMLYLSGWNPLSPLDLTPFFFVLAGLAVYFGAMRFHFDNLVPVARHALFETYAEGVLVVNLENRIVDSNQIACRILGKPYNQLVGLRLSQVLRGWLGDEQADIAGMSFDEWFARGAIDVKMPLQDEAAYFSIRATPLSQLDGSQAGVMLGLLDVTDQKLVEGQLVRQLEEQRVLHAVAIASIESTSEDDLIERATEIIGENLFPNNFGLMLLDGATQTLRCHASYRGLENYSAPKEVELGKGVTGLVAQTGQPQRISQVRQEAAYYMIDPTTQSELCVPVKVGDRVLGVINAERHEADAFTPGEERLLVTLAGQMAVAIDRLRADATQRRWANLVEAIYQASQEIVARLDLQEVYSATHHTISQLMACDTFFIATLDVDRKGFLMVYSYGVPEDNQPVLIPYENSISARAVDSGQAVRIDDLNLVVEKGYLMGSEPYVRSVIVVPMQVGKNVIGVLSAQSFRPGAYTLEEQTILTTIANQVAIAIENARLFEDAQRRAAHLEAINAIISAAAGAVELESFMRAVLEHTLAAFNLSVGGIRVFDQFVLQNLDPEMDPVFQKVAQQKPAADEGVILISDWQLAQDISSSTADFMLKHQIRASAGVWIRYDGDEIGGIIVCANRPRLWTHEESALLQAVAKQIGSAVHRLDLLDETWQRLHDVTLFGQVIAATSASNDMDSALQKICQDMTLYFGAAGAEFTLFEEDARSARVIVEHRMESQPGMLGVVIPISGNPSMEYILEHKKPLAVHASQSDPNPDLLFEIMARFKVASLLIVPVMINQKVIGAFGIEFPQPREFQPFEVDLVQNIARQVGQGLDRLELFLTAQAHAERMARLAEISATLSRSFTISEVLQSIGEGAIKLTGAQQGAVYMQRLDGSVLCPWSSGLSDTYITRVTENAAKLPGGQLMASSEPVLLRDISQLPDGALLKKLAINEGYRSLGIWPMEYEGELVSAVACYHREPFSWSEGQQEVMLAFTRQAAVALKNAQLYEDVRRHASQMEVLNEMIMATTTALDVDILLEDGLESALSTFSLDAGGVWISGHSHVRGFPDDIGLQSARAVSKASRLGADLLAVEDWNQIDAGHPAYPWVDFMHSIGVAASITVSVPAEGIPSGGLTLASWQPRRWGEDEIALVQAVGRQLGSAVSRLSLLEKIQAQANQMQQIVDTVPEGVLLLDRRRRMLLANPAARQYLHVLAGDISPGAELSYLGDCSLEEIFIKGSPWMEVETGEPVHAIFEIAAQPIESGEMPSGWVLVLRDITREREYQQQIQMQERLATVGQLAAGIAHDFNNIMAAIVVYTDLLLMEPALSNTSRERLAIIQQQIQRAASLIRQILDFSRRSIMEHSDLDLLPFIKELDKLLDRVLPETIHLELSFQPGTYLVNADPARLQQVFMNLALNARDAMPNGGTLGFELSHFSLNPGDQAPFSELMPGNWIAIQIKDTGKGISSELLPHIFEPFFTTKPVGQGTGLGLAQVYGIIKQHNGSIDVQSQVGGGTIFKIYLPALKTPQDDQVQGDLFNLDIAGCGETILIAEDDFAARDALRILMEAYNYQVLSANNGKSAMELAKEHLDSIDLVISDIVMPEMGGLELYAALKAARSDIKFLFITGHPMNDDGRNLLEAGHVHWIQKPFSVHELGFLVWQMLGNQQKLIE